MSTLWQEDQLAELEVPTIPARVAYGDLWQLGEHRLLCGDALDTANYTLLLNGTKIDVIISDPPYGMKLDTDFKTMRSSHSFNQAKGVGGGNQYTAIIGDFGEFDASCLVSFFHEVKEQFWFGANYYAESLGDTRLGSWLVWDKRVQESSDKMFGSCFELCWSRQKHKQIILRHRWAGIFGTEHEYGNRRRLHPTQKPVRLLEDLIKRYTKPANRILDPFLGSGTTIIAAERTKRIVYGCELEPHYCDCILARWEQATGKQAVLIARTAQLSAS
jgi:DNA modification methylase